MRRGRRRRDEETKRRRDEETEYRLSQSVPQPEFPAVVTGVQLMQGVGAPPALGFWADAWSQVVKRPGAVAALCWLSVIGFFAVFAPLLANGHPVRMIDEFDERTAADAAGAFESSFELKDDENVGLDLVRSALDSELRCHNPRLRPREFVAEGELKFDAAELAAIAELLRGRSELDELGGPLKATYPLAEHLRPADVVVIVGTLLGLPFILFSAAGRAGRFGAAIYGGVLAGIIVVVSTLFRSAVTGPGASDWAESIRDEPTGYLVGLGLAVAVVGVLIPAIASWSRRIAVVIVACALAVIAVDLTWSHPLETFDYPEREARGEIRAVYTLIPWSPYQRFSSLDRQPPMKSFGEAMHLPEGTPGASRRFLLGTDAFGQDVLAQVLWACRLAISIGLVSTGIAVLIGVTIGSIMGYFGGWVDLVLFRVVEVFMAVPLLFLLIVAAGVLPSEFRSTYVMMAIIGCVTWTGAARFTRAEFLKLRSQDFVQSARAVGLPLRSILFRHMLPNGVTPVLVDASFAVAAAISIEATLSFLGLGPVDQASWGKLLASAVSAEGQFKWWLAVFPGLAIFLTVLSYNIIGESLRDAIDPKLKKARV
ncbi:MAG: ABC transporter permease [Phycisphaerales bacterium]